MATGVTASTPRNPEVNLLWRYPMAVFTCEKCGEKVDTRCKPKKCPACSESGSMCKVEAAAPPKKDKK
jgi:rubrerythrin